MTLVDFYHVELPPPPITQHIHIQTDGDYTKRVVTPFGTTRLKIQNKRTSMMARNMNICFLCQNGGHPTNLKQGRQHVSCTQPRQQGVILPRLTWKCSPRRGYHKEQAATFDTTNCSVLNGT